MSDSSNSSDEDVCLKQPKKGSKRHAEDRATSRFYTKDESQEDLPYVANNVFKIKKAKKNKYRKSLYSNDQSSFKVNFFCL